MQKKEDHFRRNKLSLQTYSIRNRTPGKLKSPLKLMKENTISQERSKQSFVSPMQLSY